MVYPLDPSKLEGGGGIRYVHNLITNYLNKGIKVKLLGIKIAEQQTFKHPLFELVTIQKPYKLRIPRYFPQILKEILKISHFILMLTIESFRIKYSDNSVIHAHRSYFLLPFILVQPNIPKICTLHMKPLEYVNVEHHRYFRFISSVYGKIESFCLKKTNFIIAINDDVNKSYIRNYPFIEQKIMTMPTGVNIDDFRLLNKAYVRHQYGLNVDDFIIVSAGRLEKIKNISFLIDCFNLFHEHIVHSKLIIIGKGPEKKKLEHQVKELNLSDDVMFSGEILPEEMPKILACGDVLALTSISEASPNVVKEALACGIPVVSTHVGDVPNIVNNKLIGLISTGFNKIHFVQCLLSVRTNILTNPKMVSNMCRNRSLDFSFEKIASETVSIYNSTITDGE